MNVPRNRVANLDFAALGTLKSVRKLMMIGYTGFFAIAENHRHLLPLIASLPNLVHLEIPDLLCCTIRMGKQIEELLQKDNRSLRINKRESNIRMLNN